MNKNVLRTLDITGSNVTRSRRELEFAFRGAERREMKEGGGEGGSGEPRTAVVQVSRRHGIAIINNYN